MHSAITKYESVPMIAYENCFHTVDNGCIIGLIIEIDYRQNSIRTKNTGKYDPLSSKN